MAGLRRILATALASQDDLVVSDGKILITQVNAFLKSVPKLKKRNDFKRWPEVWQTDTTEAIQETDRLLTGGLLLRAAALASTIEDLFPRRRDRLEAITASFKRTQKRIDGADEKLQEIAPDEPVPQDYTDLVKRLGVVKTGLTQATTAWEGLGDADAVESILSKQDGEVAEIFISAKMYAFKGAKTLHMMQGAYTAPGASTTLLSQIDSEGVCLAMSMDWLGLGGSKSEPGTIVDGQITARHTRWQAQGTLEGTILQSMRAIEHDESHLTAFKRAASYIEPAKELLTTLKTELSELPAERDDLTRRINERRVEIDTENLLLRELGFDEVDPKEDFTLVDLTAQLTDVQTRLADAPGGILAQKLLIVQLKELAKATSAPVEHDGVELDVDDLSDQLERALLARQRAERKRQEQFGTGGPILPSANYRAFGIEPVPEDPLTVEGSKLVEGGKLTASDVEGFLSDLVDSVEPGEPQGFEIGLRIPEGHSTAARVTRPAPEDIGGAPDIELFDPNIGAYRFNSKEAAVACFRAWFTDIYECSWTHMSAKKMRQTGERLDGLTNSGGDSLVSGVSMDDAWEEDLDLVETICGGAIHVSDMPKPTIDAIQLALERAQKLGSKLTSTVDLKVAQAALRRAQNLARNAIQLHSQCGAADKAVRRRIDPTNLEYKPARDSLVKARTAHAAGRFDDALDDYRRASNYLDLLQATLDLSSLDEVEV
jgi:hypothetical protein